MLVVVFFQLFVLDADVLANLLADDTLPEHLVLHVVSEILEGYARLFLYPIVELVGIRNSGLLLNGRYALGKVGVDVDIKVLGLLHKQQIVDAILQQVFRLLGHLFVESSSGQALVTVRFG